MTVASATGRTPASALWNTFDAVRDRLYRQHQDVQFEPDTGIDVAALQAEVDRFVAAHPEMPRVLLRAHSYRIVVMRGQIAIDPCDWFVDKLDHGGILQRLRNGWQSEVEDGAIAAEATWCRRAYELGIAQAGFDLGHISPGWENMFRAGLSGLIEEATRRRGGWGTELTDGQIAFYRAVEIVYRATIALAQRFAELARRMATERPEHGQRLRAMAAACERVPAHAPRTFHEALQFSWSMHELIEMEGEMVRSMGHFDRTLYPYYKADIDSGRLTREQAKELIKFSWIKHHARTQGRQNGKNFVFGGQDAEGNAIANELTYLALEAYEELEAPDPKLSVRFVPQTPDKLLRRVADLIRKGYNSFVLMNDVPAVEALVRRGKTLEDARCYLPIGCYEPAVDGKEVACTMNIIINLAKGVELALHNGLDPLTGERVGLHTGDPLTFSSFEQVWQAYAKQMDCILTRATEYTKAHEKAWPNVNPSPLLAGTIDDCLARGLDIGEGGAHYNSVGCVGLALATAADSLAAIEQIVFYERRHSMAELIEALRTDFQGHEALRSCLIHAVPKWGNDESSVDALAKRIADFYCDRIHSFTNARGGPFQASLFSLTHRLGLGRGTSATPDGRKSREALSPNVSPTAGRDLAGVTAMINSVTKLDFNETPNGSVLDVMLHPTAVRGEQGLDAFASLIKTFLAKGGYAIQFNVVDPGTLRAAQRDPEQYGSLQIRVTGWSVHFVTLSRAEQNHYIERTFHCA